MKGIGARINRALFGTKGVDTSEKKDKRLGKRGLFGRGGAAAVLGPENFGKDLRTGIQGAAIGAGAAFGLAVRDAIKFDETLTRLDISSNGAMGRLDQVRAQILGVSSETGVAKEQLTEGAAAFVALTGDGKAAAESMKTFARVQKATGAEMGDIAGAAAALREQLGIGAGDFEDAFSILVAGGKAGKIELKDMASLTASLGANFKQFAGSQGLGGLANLGAAFQITARNFGSASEAATGLESLMGSIIQHSGKLKEAGVNVFESDGQTLKSLDGIVDAITKKNFNPTELIELLGRKEAYKTLQALRDNREEWRKIGKETRNAKDITVDYDKFSRSSAAKMAKSWNDLKITISEALDPERVDAIAKAVGGLVTALSTAAGLVVGTGEGIGTFVAKVAEGLGLVETKSEASLAEESRNRVSGWSDEELSGWAGAAAMGGRDARDRELARRRRARDDARMYDVTADASRQLNVPTMLEADSRGMININTSVSLKVDANADGAQFEAGVKRIVEQDREKLSREIATHLGQ